ncbi:MAG TPA: pyridoxamine 5'-phosphate oxidase family protein [Anaeromyxobacteraceae bacterium]|nr:pyridoxamine 5'-phosphate oxidase family protein [Anaeromyxobacteraceae bacterium]
MTASPFHAGEIEAQERAGEAASGGGIRDFMTAQHRTFFEALPFVILGGSDGGWPVGTLLAGEPGFVSAPDPRTLRIAGQLPEDDPASRVLVEGAPVGVLGIDLGTRRRNRANGVVTSADREALVVAVRQSFGNCPQYIHVRELQGSPRKAQPAAERLAGLDAAARSMISAADTFFVTTAARTDESRGGVDVSHRGGPRGFVRVDGSTLTVPDYRGNRYFNTLGNLVSNPRAALLFVDFDEGDLLHVQGTAEILWDAPDPRSFPAAERSWRVRVEAVVRRRGAVPLRGRPRATGAPEQDGGLLPDPRSR